MATSADTSRNAGGMGSTGGAGGAGAGSAGGAGAAGSAGGAGAAGSAGAARAARRTERAPSGGWRTIAAKEFTDHVESIRFVVLLVVIGLAAIIPMYFISTDISSSAPQLSGQPALFLALFVVGSQTVGGVTTVAFAALLVPLVGIAFGFDGINSERSQGTLSRLLAQPIHRDDIVNGKFAAGIAVIAVMLGALVMLVSALGIVRLGIIPTPEELARVVTWWLATILYASFWLAFALLLSVVIRGAASAALVGFGSWLGLILFGQFLLPLLAGALFPINTTGTINDAFASSSTQQLFLRISPATLYQDIVTALMNPATKSVLGVGNLGQYQSAQEQLPTLLSLDQSILLVWPQIVVLVALTVAMFALAYVLFLRQEVRA
jgi:ABC-2 type transport system permease protein